MTEREILAASQHPFIVTLHWCWASSKNIYFVMDFCSGGWLSFELLRSGFCLFFMFRFFFFEGEFFRVLQRTPNKCLQEEAVKFYAAEVLLALEYLHILGFIYRDLKPENILLHETGHIKLTDFDLSKASQQPTNPQVISWEENLFSTCLYCLLLGGSRIVWRRYQEDQQCSRFGHELVCWYCRVYCSWSHHWYGNLCEALP